MLPIIWIFMKSMCTTHNGNKIIILVHQWQKRVSGLMMMVKADDDHDNDEGGFRIGRVVRISQVYQLRICLGRIPIQPPYHILSFHPTTKTRFFQVYVLLHSAQTFLHLHTHLLPPNQPYHAWKLYHGFRNVQTLMESFQFKPTHSCFHCVIFINHPIHVLEKHTALC